MRAQGLYDVDREERERAHRSRVAELYLATSRSDTEGEGPRFNAQGAKTKGSRPSSSSLMGWRFGLVVNTLIAFLILVVAVICLTLAVSRSRMLGGESAIATGDCQRIRRVSWAVQAVISLCLIALLAISNYAFQVLSSPTRAEVSAAHDHRRWLDIGIPSFKNLVRISRVRAILAVFILLVAFTLQVL